MEKYLYTRRDTTPHLVHAASLGDQPQGIPIMQAWGEDESIGAKVTKWIVRRVQAVRPTLEDLFFDAMPP